MKKIQEKTAFTAVIIPHDGYRIGKATENQHGYTPCPEHGQFPSWDSAKRFAEALNNKLGLTKLEAWEIVASSMHQDPQRN